jgi:replicative DNA helicase
VKTLPHDIRAERAVIGTLVTYPEAFVDITGMAAEDDFHLEPHRAVYRAVAKLHQAGGATDITAIEAALALSGSLNLVGGLEGLSQLSECRTTQAVRHARRVRDLAGARRAIVLAMELAEEGEAAMEDPIAFIDRMTSRVADASSVQRHATAVPASVVVRELVEDWKSRAGGARPGLQTRWPRVNELTTGLQDGEYIVIAARPSSGKSALVLNLAIDAVTRGEGIPTMFVSLEMSRLDLMKRATSDLSGVDFNCVRSGKMGETLFASAMQASSRLDRAPLYIDAASGLTIGELAARVRQWRRDPKRGAAKSRALVVVDYLQRLRPSSKPESREQAIAEVSRGLQTLAAQIQCPLVVAAQLNRDTEKSKRRPMMSDLRESGSIEQDADVIAFIHRPDRMDDKIEKGTTEFILEKQRNGETGIVNMYFDGAHQRFNEITTRYAG